MHPCFPSWSGLLPLFLEKQASANDMPNKLLHFSEDLVMVTPWTVGICCWGDEDYSIYDYSL